jgi:RNA polymerase sigma factor (sigma-70 family)
LKSDPANFTIYSVETYVAVVIRRARAIVFSKTRHGANADDISQIVGIQFLSDAENIMATYEPEVFAAVAVKNRINDFHRSERVQTGSGARLHTDPDGTVRSGRKNVILETVTEHGEAPMAGHVDFAADLIGSLDLLDAIALLDPIDQQLFRHVDIEGFSVTDAAKRLGIGRTGASRRLSAARRVISGHVMAA